MKGSTAKLDLQNFIIYSKTIRKIQYHIQNLFTHKNIKYLYRLKCEIQELPWEIWTNNDVHDPNYKQKRIQLIGKVMHIQNHIRGYVIAKYGEGELSKEFSEYSFSQEDIEQTLLI